jgi:hypothetical protein
MHPVIDHVPLGWSDLETLEDAFRRIGFDPAYGGVHADGGTEMSTVGFPDGSYLELLAPTGDGEPQYWADALHADLGPVAWCAEVPSVHAECQRMIEQDVAVSGPHRGGRDLADGGRAEWDQAFFGAPTRRDSLPFVIADRTPRDDRISPDDTLLGGPYSGVGAVVVAVEDLEDTIDLFERLYRFPSARYDEAPTFGASLAAFPGQDVVLAEPHDGTALADRVAAHGDRPCSCLVSANVSEAKGRYDLGAGQDWFGRRVAFYDDPLLGDFLGVVDRTGAWS